MPKTNKSSVEALVAEIIDTRKLALNIGSDKEINVGDVFEIYSKQTHTIKDPVKNTILGEINIPKTQVKVISVSNKFCIAQTFKKKSVNIGGIMEAFGTSRLLSPPKYVDQYETLVDNEDVRPLKPEDSKVKIGDKALKIDSGFSSVLRLN